MGQHTDSPEHEEIQHARWDLLRRISELLQIPMIALSFIWLGLLILDFTTGLNPALTGLTYTIWAIFILDFLLEFAIAPHKSTYLRTHWLTVIALVLPVLRIFALFRVLQILRMARAVCSVGAALASSLLSLMIFDLLLVAAVLFNAGGWVFDWYSVLGPYDEITHAFTTFTVTFALGVLVVGALRRDWIVRRHTLIFIVMVASFGIAIGATWEIIEWTADHVPGWTIVNGLDDTISDLMTNSLGALVAAIVTWGLARASVVGRHPEQTSPPEAP